jgi:hypothetical protein
MASTNGKVKDEVAEKIKAEVPVKLWLHPDALRPRDYLRGKIALREVLEELKMDSCYEMLSGDYMYPWIMWALRSRTNPKFTWDEALDSDFYNFEMSDSPPQTLPLDSSGRSETGQSENESKAPPPKLEPEPSSASSSG